MCLINRTMQRMIRASVAPTTAARELGKFPVIAETRLIFALSTVITFGEISPPFHRPCSLSRQQLGEKSLFPNE